MNVYITTSITQIVRHVRKCSLLCQLIASETDAVTAGENLKENAFTAKATKNSSSTKSSKTRLLLEHVFVLNGVSGQVLSVIPVFHIVYTAIVFQLARPVISTENSMELLVLVNLPLLRRATIVL